jgi:hypothetical protein
MTQQQQKRYFYISQLSWESRKLKTQKQPQERSRKVESSSRNKVEKGNSTAAAATTTTVSSRRQANKIFFSKKRQTAGKRAMRLMVRLAGRDWRSKIRDS